MNNPPDSIRSMPDSIRGSLDSIHITANEVSNWVITCEELKFPLVVSVKEVEKISALLSEDRYESKDWKQADLAGRIEWLIAMLEVKSEEVDMWVNIIAEPKFGVTLVHKMRDRITELEGQIKTVLDRETSILRYYDAKLDAAEAKLTVVEKERDDLRYLAKAETREDAEAFRNNAMNQIDRTWDIDRIKDAMGIIRTEGAISKIKGEQP